MLRIPQCISNRHTDGGEVISPRHRPRSIPQKHKFSASCTYFCYRLSKFQGLVRPEGLGKCKENSFNSSGLEPATFRLVEHYHYATACPQVNGINCIITYTHGDCVGDRIYQNTRRHILEYNALHCHRCKNMESVCLSL
jgi:hypothetical protein